MRQRTRYGLFQCTHANITTCISTRRAELPTMDLSWGGWRVTPPGDSWPPMWRQIRTPRPYWLSTKTQVRIVDKVSFTVVEFKRHVSLQYVCVYNHKIPSKNMSVDLSFTTANHVQNSVLQALKCFSLCETSPPGPVLLTSPQEAKMQQIQHCCYWFAVA